MHHNPLHRSASLRLCVKNGTNHGGVLYVHQCLSVVPLKTDTHAVVL